MTDAWGFLVGGTGPADSAALSKSLPTDSTARSARHGVFLPRPKCRCSDRERGPASSRPNGAKGTMKFKARFPRRISLPFRAPDARGEFRPPRSRPFRLARGVVEPDEPLQGLDPVTLLGRTRLGVPCLPWRLQTLVAGEQQQLGLGVLVLAEQALAEEALDDSPRGGTGLRPIEALEAFAQGPFGLGALPFPEQVQPEQSQRHEDVRVAVRMNLARSCQRFREQRGRHRILTLQLVDAGKTVDGLEQERVLIAEQPARSFKHLNGQRLRP